MSSTVNTNRCSLAASRSAALAAWNNPARSFSSKLAWVTTGYGNRCASAPNGIWRVTGGFWRADRLRRPITALPLRPLRRTGGWCDAPSDRNYNRPVSAPYPASHEALWREDRLYDIVLTLSHNTRPRVRGLGSAVFAHIAGEEPTAGCVALSLTDMRKLLPWIGPKTAMAIG